MQRESWNKKILETNTGMVIASPSRNAARIFSFVLHVKYVTLSRRTPFPDTGDIFAACNGLLSQNRRSCISRQPFPFSFQDNMVVPHSPAQSAYPGELLTGKHLNCAHTAGNGFHPYPAPTLGSHLTDDRGILSQGMHAHPGQGALGSIR